MWKKGELKGRRERKEGKGGGEHEGKGWQDKGRTERESKA